MGGCILIYMGICEDKQVVRDYIRLLLEEYARQTNLVCEIDAYPDGQTFLEANKTYDILFLDVVMPGLDGLALGALLRQKNQWPKIIYITGHSKYALPAYNIHAFDYLLKPFKHEEFFKKIDEAVQSLRRENWRPPREKLVFESRTQIVCLHPGDICYIEAAPRHTLQIHTKDAAYNVRMTLSEAQRLTAGHGFARPHRSFLVNFAHMQCVEGRELRMEDGTIIPLAPKRQPSFKAAFHSYQKKSAPSDETF